MVWPMEAFANRNVPNSITVNPKQQSAAKFVAQACGCMSDILNNPAKLDGMPEVCSVA